MLYSSLTSEVLPDVMGCPDVTIERAIRDACIELCAKGSAYVVQLDPIKVVAGVSEIDLELPTATRLVSVIRAQLGSQTLSPRSRDDLDRSSRDWRQESGMPREIAYESSTSIRLVPEPDQTLSSLLYIRVAVAPTKASTSIPDEIGERFYKEICAGAKANLMLMPGMPWTNPVLSQAHRALFDRALKESKVWRSMDSVGAERRVRLTRLI